MAKAEIVTYHLHEIFCFALVWPKKTSKHLIKHLKGTVSRDFLFPVFFS